MDQGQIDRRGYRRSDQRIYEDVCDLLSWHPDLDASDIDVVVADGEVTLRGTVPSRWQKRLAEDLVDHVAGVVDLHSELRVAPAAPQGRAGAGAEAGTPGAVVRPGEQRFAASPAPSPADVAGIMGAVGSPPAGAAETAPGGATSAAGHAAAPAAATDTTATGAIATDQIPAGARALAPPATGQQGETDGSRREGSD